MIRKHFALPLAAAAILSLTLLTGCDGHSSSQKSQQTTVAAAQSNAADGTGTVGSGFDSQPSDAPRINVQLVQQALSQVQQSDPQNWLQDFEQRVNEIYEGDEVVSIDAHTDASNNLQIIGYISRTGQQGYQSGDDQLFSISQTGAVTNNDAPYRMTYYTYGGYPAYYSGYYHNPFLTAWIVHSLVHPWHGYYTMPARVQVIHSYRTTYRTTPVYAQQHAATQHYNTQTYHGAPVTVRPGASKSSIGTHVAPATVTPGKAATPTKTFNRPNSAPPTAVTPPKSTTPTSTFKRPSQPLQSRPGGLFNRNTFKPSRPSFGGSRRR